MTMPNKDLSPPGYPPAHTPRKSHVVPIVVTIVCGFLLALCSCFGFVATLTIHQGNNKLLSMLSGWGMVAGALLFVAGIIWGIVAIIVHIVRSRSEGL